MNTHPKHTNLLLFNLFDKEGGVLHFSSTRLGGVSNGTYASFNMGNFSDDDPVNIHKNRDILAKMFYMDTSNFIIPHQTHGTRVLKIDEEFMGLNSVSAIEKMYGVDAAVSNLKGIFLCITTADCVPIIIYDKGKEAIAAVHAGWKGTVGRIVEKTIVEMQKLYGSNTADMIAGIGPAISVDKYEVGDEVAEHFISNGFNITDPKLGFRKQSTSKYHLNLKEINRRELLRLGLRENNIEMTDMCTYKREELFFSARRQTKHSGRMLTGIMMKQNNQL